MEATFAMGRFGMLSNKSAITAGKDKQLVHDLLAKSGVPTLRGSAFQQDELERASTFALSLGAQVVVKPQFGKRGLGVSVGVGQADFRDAFLRAASFRSKVGSGVIVQEHAVGHGYRVLVDEQNVLAAYLRDPAHVIGDGTSTVRELVEMKNAVRFSSLQRGSRSRRLQLDVEALACLARKGLTPTSVPDTSQRVDLALVDNVHHGADVMDVTDELHASVIRAAIEALHAIPGLRMAGVDLILPSGHRIDFSEQRGLVLEVNANAGIVGHLHPTHGRSRDVADALVRSQMSQRGFETSPSAENVEVVVRATPTVRLTDGILAEPDVLVEEVGGQGTVLLAGSIPRVAAALEGLAERSAEVLFARIAPSSEGFKIPSKFSQGSSDEASGDALTACPWLPRLRNGELGGREQLTIRAVVSGRVTGVGFRAFIEEQARDSNLDGWTRNVGGSVEIVLRGDEFRVNAALARILRGPTKAKVQGVTTQLHAQAVEEGFIVLPSM